MALLKIAEVGNPILRRRSREVSREELLGPTMQTLIDDLIETMRDADGAGIAAPQVHLPVRICVIEIRPNHPRYPEKEPIPLTVLVNPVVTPTSDATLESFEGCLSVPNLRGRVRRHADILVRFWDRAGQEREVRAHGIQAVTYQHECDHLDGRLFVDRVTDPTSFTTWRNYATFVKDSKDVAVPAAVR